MHRQLASVVGPGQGSLAPWSALRRSQANGFPSTGRSLAPISAERDRQRDDQVQQGDLLVWGSEEVMAFLSHVEERPTLHVLYALTVETGMRRGKVLCLRWLDVDLNVGEVRIQQTLISTSHQVRFRQSKLGAVTDRCD